MNEITLQLNRPIRAEDLSWLRASAVPVLAAPQQFAAEFYHRVFARAPGLRVLFGDDQRAQQQKMLQLMTMVITRLEDLEALAPQLRAMGAAQVKYGAKPHHYEVMVDSLLETLAQANGAQFGSEAHRAWSEVLTWIGGQMLKGARTQPVKR